MECLKFKANDDDGSGAVWLRQKLRGRNDTAGFNENEPRLPNSVLLASGKHLMFNNFVSKFSTAKM